MTRASLAGPSGGGQHLAQAQGVRPGMGGVAVVPARGLLHRAPEQGGQRGRGEMVEDGPWCGAPGRGHDARADVSQGHEVQGVAEDRGEVGSLADLLSVGLVTCRRLAGLGAEYLDDLALDQHGHEVTHGGVVEPLQVLEQLAADLRRRDSREPRTEPVDRLGKRSALVVSRHS